MLSLAALLVLPAGAVDSVGALVVLVWANTVGAMARGKELMAIAISFFMSASR